MVNPGTTKYVNIKKKERKKKHLVTGLQLNYYDTLWSCDLTITGHMTYLSGIGGF